MKFPLKSEKVIFNAYNSGRKRSEIKKKYNITDTQFVVIIKKSIMKESAIMHSGVKLFKN